MLLNMDRVLGLLAEGKDIEKIAVLASCPREDVVALIEEARTLLARHEGPRFRKKVVLKKKIQRIGDDERYEEEERELFQGPNSRKFP
jgi:hypothetical protein